MKFARIVTVPIIAMLVSCSTTTMEPADSPTLSLSYSLTSQSFVKVFVENSYGVTVLQAVNQIQPAGTYAIQIRLAGVPEGLYYAIVSANDNEIRRFSLFVTRH